MFLELWDIKFLLVSAGLNATAKVLPAQDIQFSVNDPPPQEQSHPFPA